MKNCFQKKLLVLSLCCFGLFPEMGHCSNNDNLRNTLNDINKTFVYACDVMMNAIETGFTNKELQTLKVSKNYPMMLRINKKDQYEVTFLENHPLLCNHSGFKEALQKQQWSGSISGFNLIQRIKFILREEELVILYNNYLEGLKNEHKNKQAKTEQELKKDLLTHENNLKKGILTKELENTKAVLAAKLKNEKATKLEVAQQNFENWIKSFNKKNLTRASTFLVVTGSCLCFSYFFFMYLIENMFRNIPIIIAETSLPTGLRDKIWGKKKLVSHSKDLIFKPPLMRRLNTVKRFATKRVAAKLAGDKHITFYHMVLHGPPGTGKTHYARSLAIDAGFAYIMIDGARWGQLNEQERLKEFYRLIRFAKACKRPVLIFIDEADSIFRKDGSRAKLVSAFLATVPTASDANIKFVMATNRLEDLDPAIIGRGGRVNPSFIIHIDVPDATTCGKQLAYYLKKAIKQRSTGGSSKISIDSRVYRDIEVLGEKLYKCGYTGRNIRDLAGMFIQNLSLGKGKKFLSYEDIDRRIMFRVLKQASLVKKSFAKPVTPVA